MTDLLELGVTAAADAIRRGRTTSAELVDACLARIDATDDALRAWVTVDRATAAAEARSRDHDQRAGQPRGPLHGVPIGVKDIVDVAGMPTTAGAAPFAHTHPTSDATLVARLRAAGAVILGKTVATEFAFKDPAPTRNPWSAAHTPGGSSSGSAAAVAARQVPAAIGTQTVGSILRPAAFCGVVGLKGVHGEVPLDGVAPLARSLDHGGPIARSVADVALVEGALLGRPLDVPRVDAPRFVVSPELLERAEPELRRHLGEVAGALTDAGAGVAVEALPGSLTEIVDAGWLILEVEAAEAHASMFAAHADGYGRQIGALVRAGLARRPAERTDAERVRAAFRGIVVPWLESYDALLSPVAPGPAPRRGEGTGDPTLCSPWSTIGVPAIAIPTGVGGDGLPLAVQLVAGPRGLARLLGVAAWCERLLGFEARPA